MSAPETPPSDTSPAAAVPAGLKTIMDFLRGHAPFDHMRGDHLETLARALSLGYYPSGTVVAAPEQGVAQRLFIIRQGRVRGEYGDDAPAADGWELGAGECFPVGALLSQRPVRGVQRAVEDTFCLELQRADFEQLLSTSPEFHDFCTRRLASLLDRALRAMLARSAAQAADSVPFAAPLSALLRRAPVVCAPHTALREALATMQHEHVGSIVAVDADRHPQGLFTLHDLLTHMAGSASDAAVAELLAAPIATVMTQAPLTLRSEAQAHEAALLMLRHGIGHVCVVESGRLVGVLSERDLFALQRVALVRLSRQLRAATDIDTLVRLSGEVRRLIGQLLAQGIAIEHLTEIIAQLNDEITRRAIELCLYAPDAPPVTFTWLAFGSEGRQEQTIATDQDNGLLFIVPAGADADAVRALLLPFAQQVNAALMRCGFPACAGGIMAGNPRWCLSLEEWRATFADWIARGDAPVLLDASIFFDFRPLYGPEEPVRELRDWLTGAVQDNRGFQRHMAANALTIRPPLGLLGDFVVSDDDNAGTLDLKLHGAMPFINAARVLGMTAGSDATGTVARLRAAGARWHMDSAEIDAWVQAFLFIQLLRLRRQYDQQSHSEKPDNRIDPQALNPLDRRILKEAFRQARKLQSRLATLFRF